VSDAQALRSAAPGLRPEPGPGPAGRAAERFRAPQPPPEGAGRRAEDRYLWAAFRFHSRTFSLATRLLPRPVQRPIATLYLYCRTIDTLADERVHTIGPARALAEVDAMERALDRTLTGTPPDELLWRRLAEVHARYRLDAFPLKQLLDGARWDLHERPVQTLGDLLAYAELVAGSVGAAMLPFLVRDDADRARLEAPARALGNAMQLTNILRDVGEDWRDLGRTYLPAEWLDAHGVRLGSLVDGAPPVPAAYAEMTEALMAEADRLYDEAEDGIVALRRRAQAGIRGASRMYREFLNGVRANGYDNLSRRAAVPLPRKLLVLAGADSGRRRARLTGRPTP